MGTRYSKNEGANVARIAVRYHRNHSKMTLMWTLLVAGAGVLVLQSGFIAALLIQRARRVRAQNALRENQHRYAMATAAGAVGVWDWDFATNEIYVDPTLKSILGLDAGVLPISADVWGSRIHPDDLALAAARTKACIDGTVDEYEVEHRMIHKDGSVRWFLSRGSLVTAADGASHRMIGTKVDITERKRAENAIRESEAVLQATTRELQDLAGRLIASQEVERARLARDLHDGLSQQLAGLSIALSGIKRRAVDVPGAGDLHADLSTLQQRTIGLAEDIRHLSHDLHPSVLEHAGLVAALAAHCTDLQRRELVDISFEADGDFTTSAANADVDLCLYRVAQEALRNVVTHARARNAEVRLARIGDRIQLSVADDGRGFDINQASAGAKGLGLVSINERVRIAGGTVSIMTEVNKGTRVRVDLPVERRPAVVAAPFSDPYAASA
jgi:PAS domain S-box-containing protein